MLNRRYTIIPSVITVKTDDGEHEGGQTNFFYEKIATPSSTLPTRINPYHNFPEEIAVLLFIYCTMLL